jgi:hypothetical protein
MGINLRSGDQTFSCSYSGWNNIRLKIIKACYYYLQETFQKDLQSYGHITNTEDEHWIGHGSIYSSRKKDMRQFNLDTNLPCVVLFKTALNYFQLGGLHALCNQSDCDGYYTPGNSLDICCMFDKIQPFIKEQAINHTDYAELYDTIYDNLYNIFEHSYTTVNTITID